LTARRSTAVTSKPTPSSVTPAITQPAGSVCSSRSTLVHQWLAGLGDPAGEPLAIGDPHGQLLVGVLALGEDQDDHPALGVSAADQQLGVGHEAPSGNRPEITRT
jgi:hypothetical protein